MKKNFFNITKAFLLGLALVAVGCSDYDEDIKDLNNRIDAVTSQITGEIDLTKVDLDNTKKDLNVAKEALAALQVKHDADIAALKASDETLKSSIAEANAAIVALKGDLTAAESALNNKVDGVQAELDAKINAEIATVNEKIAAAEAQIEGLKANVSELNTKDAELDKKIADLDEEMAALNTELSALISKNAEGIAGNAAAIKALQENMAQYAQAFVEYQATVAAQIGALEAKDAQIETSIATINDAITRIDASIDAIQSGKVNVTDFEAYKAEVLAQYTTLEDAIFALEYADVKLNQTDKELSDRIYNVKTSLQASLDEAFGNIGANTTAIAALQAEVAANLAKINATNASLNSAIDQFTAAIQALEAKDKALDAKDEELALEIVAKYAELAKEIEALEANDKAIQTKCDELKAQIETEIANRTAADAAINTDLKAKYDELIANCEALAKADDEILAKIDAEVKKLADKDDEILKIVAANYAELTTKAAGLQDQINMLMMINTDNSIKQAAALQALADKDAELAADLLAKYEELKEADAALAQADKDLESALTTKFAEELQKSDAKEALAFAAVWEKIAEMDATDKGFAAQIASLMTKDTELANQIVALTATVNDNTDRIAALETSLSDFQKEYEAYKSNIDKVVRDLKDHIVSVEGLAVKLDKETTATFNTMNEKEFAAVYQEIEDVKKELNTNISKLMKRVQSIVYVPEYNDGKATIKYAKMTAANAQAEKIIEAASSMQYQVYPAACAEAIATAWEADNSTLMFDVRGVKDATTRSGSVAALNIKDVKVLNAVEGLIEITFWARNFAPEFYANTASYSTSLILNYKNDVDYSSANLQSSYTNLVPSVNGTEKITVTLTKETANYDSLFIEYTMRNSTLALEKEKFETEGKKNVLEGLNVVYSIDGGAAKTYAEMIADGYDVAVPEFSYEVKGYNHDPLVTGVTENDAENGKFTEASLLSFFDYDNIKDGEELAVAPATREVATTIQPVVWLTAEATASTVGSKLEYTGTFDVDGFELSATQFVVVAPNIVTINASVDPIVWNYADDAEVDAAYLADPAQTAKVYKRNNLKLKFAEGDLDQLDGVKINELVTSGYTGLDGFAAAGLQKARIANGSAEGEVVIAEFEKFKWNETINLVYKYTKNKSIHVDLAVTINTVDRNRTKVVEIPASATVELEKDLTAIALDAIYNDLKDVYNIGDSKDDFLNDVLGKEFASDDKALMASDGNSYPVVDHTTTITVDGAAKTANVSFDYNDFSFIPTQVVYTDEITLWYGQEVKLIYTVDFAMPSAAYNFSAVDLWVMTSEKTKDLYSQVQGNYSPNKESVALTSFSVSNIDMDKAFVVTEVVGEETKVVADPAALGLVTEFEIEDDNVDAGIEFTGNVLAYNGKTDAVNVKGNLYLEHTNGARIALETVFETEAAYANYVVNKFDPFTALEAEDITIDIKEVQEYKLDVRSRFSIYESRDGSGDATKLGANEFTVDLLSASGAYIVGNGSNGWAKDKTINAIYGGLEKPKMTFKVVESTIDDKYAHVIKYDEVKRILSFDNTPNLVLDKKVTIKVVATIDYTWGSKDATLNVTFQPKK